MRTTPGIPRTAGALLVVKHGTFGRCSRRPHPIGSSDRTAKGVGPRTRKEAGEHSFTIGTARSPAEVPAKPKLYMQTDMDSPNQITHKQNNKRSLTTVEHRQGAAQSCTTVVRERYWICNVGAGVHVGVLTGPWRECVTRRERAKRTRCSWVSAFRRFAAGPGIKPSRLPALRTGSVVHVDLELVDVVADWCVVVRGLPRVVGDSGLFDLVDEHRPPWLPGFAGGGACLVGEDLGAAVLPSERMGAQEAVLVVVARSDAATLGDGLLEDRPGRRPSGRRLGHECTLG